MYSNGQPQTEVCIGATTVIKKVPVICTVVNLLTLEKYQDRKSIVGALMDEKFSNPVLTIIAAAIQEKDQKLKKRILGVMQQKCCYSEFKKVQQALDDKGCKYDTKAQIVGWKGARAWARCFIRRIKASAEKNNASDMRIAYRKKTFASLSRKKENSLGQ